MYIWAQFYIQKNIPSRTYLTSMIADTITWQLQFWQNIQWLIVNIKEKNHFNFEFWSVINFNFKHSKFITRTRFFLKEEKRKLNLKEAMKLNFLVYCEQCNCLDSSYDR